MKILNREAEKSSFFKIRCGKRWFCRQVTFMTKIVVLISDATTFNYVPTLQKSIKILNRKNEI
jgi:hypothetical protein